MDQKGRRFMPKRPRDLNQLAKAVVDMTTGAARNDSHDEPSGRARGKRLT